MGIFERLKQKLNKQQNTNYELIIDELKNYKKNYQQEVEALVGHEHFLKIETEEKILKMIEEDRYCIDIYDQINATRAILNTTNNAIMEAHIKHCVKEAIINEDDTKIEEALKAINRSK